MEVIMKLKELTLENCEQIKQWRNECLEALRTPFLLTKEMQEQFYKDIICSRDARARYWGVWECTTNDDTIRLREEHYGNKLFCDYNIFIGMVGLENIEWENRRSEISIILNPEYRGKGYGEQAVDLLLEQGFMYLNLENIWGECYECNKSYGFWDKIIKKYNCIHIPLPDKKYWNGIYWNALYFNFNKGDWKK
jgi:RimJ/RimL family protein N-acetyltransferase